MAEFHTLQDIDSSENHSKASTQAECRSKACLSLARSSGRLPHRPTISASSHTSDQCRSDNRGLIVIDLSV